MKNNAKVSKKTCRKTTARKPTSLWKNWQAQNKRELPPFRAKLGKCLTEEQDILERWTGYCSELHTHTTGDPKVLDVPPSTNNDSYLILREEVEAAVKSLKKGKSAGVDNIPSELVQVGREAMIDMLLIICNKIWQTGEWPTPWTQSLIITLPKKGNLQLCQNCRTINLISHPRKVMLRILLNRLKPQAEEIIKEWAGFRAGRSTTEQIFNLRILCEKYLQHQQSLYHVFVNFKKAFDRVWHAALWATMRLYNINDNLIRTIECLYNKASSTVYHDNNLGEWFQTTIGVCQGCLLSPNVFNIFLERIMANALEDHEGTFSIVGRTITNLRFADDIDGLAGQEQELVKLVNHLEEASTAYGMQISAEKTQLMTNNTNGISTDITMENKKLETVRSGATVWDEGSKPEVLSRIAQTTAAVTNEGSKPEVLSRIAQTTAAVTNEGSKPEVLSRIAQATAAVNKLKSSGTTRTWPSAPSSDWCVPWPFPYFCMHVKLGP